MSESSNSSNKKMNSLMRKPSSKPSLRRIKSKPRKRQSQKSSAGSVKSNRNKALSTRSLWRWRRELIWLMMIWGRSWMTRLPSMTSSEQSAKIRNRERSATLKSSRMTPKSSLINKLSLMSSSHKLKKMRDLRKTSISNSRSLMKKIRNKHLNAAIC